MHDCVCIKSNYLQRESRERYREKNIVPSLQSSRLTQTDGKLSREIMQQVLQSLLK